MTDTPNRPLCVRTPGMPLDEEPEHEWRYDGGDPSTGVNGAWICQTCGAVDIDREPPSYDDDY